MSHHASRPFIWVPGEGPDRAALRRLADAFPKPSRPMGEAWFMARERKTYPQLLGELDAVSDRDLEEALVETAAGPGSFGPRDEWTEWYHYLLPRLINRRWKQTYYDQAELLLTAFMTHHPTSASDCAYDGFRSDALAVLGRYIMSPKFWPDGEIDVVGCLGKWRGPNGVAGWSDTGGLLSASLFFCMKYLPEAQVEPWFRSVIAVPDRYWRAQIATWLVGARPILANDIHAPGEFPESGSFGLRWSWSHVLRGDGSGDPERRPQPFLPDESRRAVLRIARDWDVESALEKFLTDPDARSAALEAAGLQDSFRRLYGDP